MGEGEEGRFLWAQLLVCAHGGGCEGACVRGGLAFTHLPSARCDLPVKDRNGWGAEGGHPDLGVCAAVTKCSAQGDLTYSFGQRQADLPEGAGVGGSPAYSRK